MAITGTGTQADPWIVTTYAELVEKADDGGYIKIGNNINITDEYPNGDMPTLEIVKSDIDGDGKVISNWYKTDSGYCINTTDSSDTTSCIHDLTILNIYIKDSASAFIKRAENNGSRAFFVNCDFGGNAKKQFTDNSSSTLCFDTCSFNVDLGSSKPFGANGGFFNNCFVEMESDYASGGFFSDINLSVNAKDTYFILNLPMVSSGNYLDQYGHGFDNCVLDVVSDSGFYVGGGSHAVSIINTTHAPNCHPDGTNTKGVTDTNWLDVSYLSSIGFNAG